MLPAALPAVREFAQQRLVVGGEGASASRRSGRPGAACGAAPAPGASGRPARGRPLAAPRAPRGPGTRPAGCTAGTRAGPSANDSSAPDASLPITPGTRRATASITTSAAASPPGEHVVADRQLAVAEVVGDPLVDALVAAAQQREARRRPRARRATAWSNRRPRGREQEQRAGRVGRLDRGEERLRASSPCPRRRRRACRRRCGDGRWCARAGRARARRADPRHAPCPRSEASSGPREVLREDGEDVDAHGRSPSEVEQALGRVDDHDAVARARRRRPSGPARRRRARAGRAPGSPPPRRPRRRSRRRGRAPRRRRPRAPRARRRRARRRRARARGGELAPRSASAAVRSSTPSNCTSHAVLVRARRSRSTSSRSSSVEHRAGLGALGPVLVKRDARPRRAARAPVPTRPTSRRSPGSGAPCPGCYSTTSTLAFTPSAVPAARPSWRSAWITRPRLPMRRPMSPGLACTISATSSPPLLDVDVDRVGVVDKVAGDVLVDGHARAPPMRLPSAPISSSMRLPSASTSSSKSSSRSSSSLGRLVAVVLGRGRPRRRLLRRRALRRPALRRPVPRRRASSAGASAAAAGAAAAGASGAGFGLLLAGATLRCVAAPRELGDRGLAALGLVLRPHAAARSRSFCTCSVGWAPLRSQAQRALGVDLAERRVLAGRVLPDDLDEPAVAGLSDRRRRRRGTSAASSCPPASGGSSRPRRELLLVSGIGRDEHARRGAQVNVPTGSRRRRAAVGTLQLGRALRPSCTWHLALAR